MLPPTPGAWQCPWAARYCYGSGVPTRAAATGAVRTTRAVAPLTRCGSVRSAATCAVPRLTRCGGACGATSHVVRRRVRCRYLRGAGGPRGAISHAVSAARVVPLPARCRMDARCRRSARLAAYACVLCRAPVAGARCVTRARRGCSSAARGPAASPPESRARQTEHAAARCASTTIWPATAARCAAWPAAPWRSRCGH